MFLCDPYHLFLLKIKSKSAWELCKAVICPYVLLVACSRGKEEGAERDSEHIPQPAGTSQQQQTASGNGKREGRWWPTAQPLSQSSWVQRAPSALQSLNKQLPKS